MILKIAVSMIKGIAIGIAMLVPGVSGGTMAIILGLYDDMIHAVSLFFHHPKKNALFLGTIGLGGIIGILAFSRCIAFLLEHFRQPMMYFFIGMIAGGIPVLYQKACIGKRKWRDRFYFVIGFIIISMMSFYNGTIVNLAVTTGLMQSIFLILAGVIVAVALILPGISTSFMLLALGLYDITIKAINGSEWKFLFPLVLGALLGMIVLTKVLETTMVKKPSQTYMLILGFVLGSIIQVFPGLPKGIGVCNSVLKAGNVLMPQFLNGCLDILVSLSALILGFSVIRLMGEKKGRKYYTDRKDKK